MAQLNGKSVLILEDEPIILLDLTELLQSEGATVFSTSDWPDAKAELYRHDIDAAIIDCGLNDRKANALLNSVVETGIPFIIHSGDASNAAAQTAPFVIKPADDAELLEALHLAIDSKSMCHLG